MLLHIVAIGLISLFLYTFFCVDNFYKKCTVIAEIEYKRSQVLSHKFLKLGVHISRLRASSELQIDDYNRSMQQLDDLVEEYENLTVKSENAGRAGFGLDFLRKTD